MKRLLLFICILTLPSHADTWQSTARLQAGQSPFVLRRLDANGRSSDVLEILSPSGKVEWSSLDHPDMPQLGGTGECQVIDLEGDGQDEIAIFGGRGAGDIHYAFLQLQGCPRRWAPCSFTATWKRWKNCKIRGDRPVPVLRCIEENCLACR